MARFVFELEAVLEQRLAAERDRQLAVAALERERLQAEDAIRRCQQGIVHEKEDWRGRLSGEHGKSGGSGGGGGTGLLDVRAIRLQATATNQLNAQAQRHVLHLAGVHNRLDA